jgi:hypothetical protein
VRLEELGQFKNPMTSSGIEPATLTAYSIVPQPNTIPQNAELMYVKAGGIHCNHSALYD